MSLVEVVAAVAFRPCIWVEYNPIFSMEGFPFEKFDEMGFLPFAAEEKYVDRRGSVLGDAKRFTDTK